MTALNKEALRGQSVEGSYYLAECGHCGEMYPSNKLDGGEPLFSGDYGECFCHLCGADDSDIADNGAWGSEAVTAWNYQQKRIEALLDEVEAAEELVELQRFKLERQAEDLHQAKSLESIHREKRLEVEREFRDYKDRAESNQMRLAKDVCRLEDELQAAGIGVKGE
ncbi:hypothetical protein AH633_002561 [Salmonella enterica subsp. enterica]|nr:hypothetical protein [Salmonella enterica subsp. enterica]EBL6882825.1 hypothetical protein [Salmonella enterica]ECD7340213.1 hypothetical protein [Salmonella enterica subsp. enterica serovar Newport]ECI4073620.1 hypothetical protein [Salmonella enterica subsp. salamae]ECK2161305.1 hypothetical protein [Salmonella enterica subsp. enterica]